MVREASLSWDSEEPIPDELTKPWNRNHGLSEEENFIQPLRRQKNGKRNKTPKDQQKN